LSSDDVESGHDAWFRSLVINFDNLAVAPDILSISTSSPKKRDIQIDLTLDEAEGTVVCAAYQSSSQYVPSEVRTLLLQNQAVEIVSENTSFTITGLIASIDYDIYCATFSTLDAVMSNEDMLGTKTTQSTACCRLIEVEILKSSVSSDEDAPNAVKVTLPSLLPDDLTLTFTTKYYVNESFLSTSEGELGNPFAPNSFSFTSSSLSLTKNIAYISTLGGVPGFYFLDFELSGTSAGSYAMSYGGGDTLVVLNSENEPAAPSIRSATFTADGSNFVVLFDAATNRGNDNNNFFCSKLFISSSITGLTKCRWADDMRVEVYSNGNDGAVVNDAISLLPESLKAKCRVLGNGGPACSVWAHSLASTAFIQPPLTPSLPSISLISPTQIGPCDALPIDLTSSSGAGGRQFASWSFAVSSRHPNSSDIEVFLSQVQTIRRPISVPTSLLFAGYAYSFSVTLCTFLGGCSLSSHTVVVSSSGNIPIVSLNSEKIRNVNRFSPLKLRGDAFTSQCGGTTSTANLAFSWEMQTYIGDEEGFVVVTDPALQSTAIDPRFFVLPAYSIPVGTLYSLILTVRHLESLKYSSTSITLTAVQGDVVAVILGSSEVGLQNDRELVLDAGDSYDEDNNLAVGAEADLLFSFNCKQVFPSFIDACLLDLALFTASSIAISVPQNDESMIGSVHEVSLVVQHATDGRKAASSLTVNILPSLAPVVEIQAESTRINPSQKLKLVGIVEFVSAGTATWTLDDTSINLEEEASSVTSRALTASDGNTQTLTMSLVIPPNVLPQQSSFNFMLTVMLDSGYSNVATIVVLTNSPPRPGAFVVSPLNGTMLHTYFSFSAENWEDSDRPISYAFGFLQDQISFSVLRTKSELSYFSSRDLPSGPVSDAYLLIAHMEVYDVMNAKASVSTPLTVVEGEEMTASDIDDYFSDSMSNSNGYSEDVKVAVAVTNVIVNSVNCSNVVVPCVSLNRYNCSNTINTCGACLNGYIGEDMDANTKCMSEFSTNQRRKLGAWTSRVGESCVSDTDCVEDNWEICHEHSQHCVVSPKQCPGDCGTNGTCIYTSALNAKVVFEECNVLQSNCIGRCVCEEGYMGLGCESRREDFVALQKTRHKLVEAIQTISLTEDATQDTLLSWLQSLSGVCKDSTGLLDETKSLIATLVLEFIDLALTFKLSFEEIGSVTSTLDLVFSALSSSDTDSASVDESSALSLKLLQAYSDFIAQDMVEGQSSVAITTPSYRLGTYAVSGSASSSAVQAPQSKLEEASSTPAQKVVLPATNSAGVMRVAVTEVASLTNAQSTNASIGGPLLSVPLGLRFDQFSCLATETNTEFCTILVVLQNMLAESFPLLSGVVTVVPEVVYKCKNRRPRNITHTCDDGFNITQSCDGTKGDLFFQCPSPFFSASCVSVGVNDSSCHLMEYTPWNVTCECTLPIRPSQPSQPSLARRQTANKYFQRRADDEDTDEGDTSVSVDFSSAASSILGEFTSTFSSADSLSLDKVLGSWEVLLTVGMIFMCSTMFISYGYVVDAREVKDMETKAQLQKVVHTKGLTSKRKRSVHVIPDAVLNPALQKKRAASLKERSKTIIAMRRATQRNKALGSDEHYSLDKALPSVLQPLPMWTRYKTELKVYHRWVGVYFHYSTVCSRPLRALSLVTNIIVMLFIEAVTYDLADPNDGSCELYETEASCLSEISSLASESKCYWDEEEYFCNFKEIKNDMMRVVIVAIFAACLGTPFAILLQVLIQKFLSGEIDEEKASSFTRFTSRGNVMMEGSRGRNLVGVGDNLEAGDMVLTRGVSMLRKSVSMKATAMVAADKLHTTLQEDLSMLFTDLRKFRRTLSQEERNTFDDIWGLSFMLDEGIGTTRNYYNKIKTFYNTVIMKRKRPELVLLDELERVRDLITSEVLMFESTQLTNAQKSKRLLFLFVRDLLDGANGQILDSKNRRDHTVRKRVTMDTKIFISVLVTFTLLGMLFYVYLFALRQTQDRQQAWFQSFVIWIIFEIFLVSTGTVFLTHILIPTFIISDVKRVKQNIVNDILSFKASVARQKSKMTTARVQEDTTEGAAAKQVFDEIETSTEFNAAKFLFPSSRLARMYPGLKESYIVAKFSTHWPRRSLKTNQKSVTKSYNNKLTFITQACSRVLLFSISSLIQLPEPLQDIFIQLVSTSGFGYIIVLLVNLWRTSPFLVAVPIVFLGLIIHFVTASSKSSSFLPLSKVQPVLKEDDLKSDSSGESNNTQGKDEVVVMEAFNDLVEESKDTAMVMNDDDNRDSLPSESLGNNNDIYGGQGSTTRELNRLQYLLWGKDMKPDDQLDDSSDSDSDEDCEAFFDNRKNEMEIYMARSEAWEQGIRDVDSLPGKDKGAQKVNELKSEDNIEVFTGLDITEAVNSLPPLNSPPPKGSPVAAALKVNSRAGALKCVRRKSSIGISSIAEGEGEGEGKEDEEEDEEENIVERILQRPKEVKLRSFSPVQDSTEVSRESHFNCRTQKVELRLRDDVKNADIAISSNLSVNIQVQNFSCSSSSGDDDDESSVHVVTKAVSSPRAATLGIESDSEEGGSKRFSAPSILKDVDDKDIKKLTDKMNKQRQGVPPVTVSKVGVTKPVDVVSHNVYDPKNPFNLNESMFEFSDDSDGD
jgi:hypothetical protein